MRNDAKLVPHSGAGRAGVSRRRALAVSVALASAILAGFAMPARAEDAKAAAEPNTVDVHIDNFAFTPAELTIAPGTTVKWTNRDDIPHTVTEKLVAFKSKTMDTDETFTHTFDAAGEVTYFCSLHPHMTGKIIVKAP